MWPDVNIEIIVMRAFLALAFSEVFKFKALFLAKNLHYSILTLILIAMNLFNASGKINRNQTFQI